jgi:carbonic anhydrase
MVEGQFTLVDAASLQLNLPNIAETEFENLGTTVEVIVPEGSGAGIVVDGTPFALKQFHFHLPSEHLDNGSSVAMEMHMVHESANAEIAVVGVYLETGVVAPSVAARSAPAEQRLHARDTAAAAAKRQTVGGVSVVSVPSQSSLQGLLTAVMSALGLDSSSLGLPAGVGGAGAVTTGGGGASGLGNVGLGSTAGASNVFDTIFASAGNIAQPGTKTAIGPLDMAPLLASLSGGQFQAYTGSLTTPPCSEGVRWFVSTQKQTISLQSFAAARDVIGFNSRFPQNALGQDNVIALANAASVAQVPV